MADDLGGTTRMHLWIDQMREGNGQAHDAILRHVSERLKRLTRKMLQDFPGVRRWEETDDVSQNAIQRLLRALRAVRPASMREFFGLAAMQIRRELLDLAKHYYGQREQEPIMPVRITTPQAACPKRRTRPATRAGWRNGVKCTSRSAACLRRSGKSSNCSITRDCRRPRPRPSWTFRYGPSSGAGSTPS